MREIKDAPISEPTRKHDGRTTPALRIMVVEDGVIMARDIQQRLTAMGFAVAGVAYNGEEAIRMVQHSRPDLVLMDVNLKGKIDGIAAAEEMHRDSDVPIVFVTGYSDPATLARIRSTNPFGFVLKPFDERELRTAVEMALYRHTLDQNLRRSEERFRVISEITSDFAYSLAVASDGTVTPEWVTGAFTRITGIPTEEFNKLRLYLHPDDIPPYEQKMISLIAGRSQVTEYRICLPEKGERWILDHARPVVDPGARRVVRIVGAAQDITDKKRAEENAQALLQRSQELGTEARRHLRAAIHRIEGGLEILSGGARGKTAVTLDEADIRRFRKMIRLHQYVYREHARLILNLGALLRHVIQEELRDAHLTRVTFDVTAEDDAVELEQALACALIVQELTSITLAQGYRNGQKGEIHLSVQAQGPDHRTVCLTQADSAAAIDLDTKNPKSQGLRFVKMLLEQLHGTVEVSGKHGTSITVRFPTRRGTM